MKPIKYRAWSIPDECYLDMKSGYFFIAPDGVFYEIYKLKNGETDYNEVYADVQFYTGFKDLNGQEIFEGDIIKYVNELYKVEFFNGGFFLKSLKKPESDDENLIYGVHFSDISDLEKMCEIVGNIFENEGLINA